MDDQLKDVETAEQLRACYPVMKQLRPHLETEDEFVARVTRMSEHGYRILAAWDEGEVVALAGYRLQENLVYGRFLYVDDLVAGEKTRGRRWGARLLERLTAYGDRAECVKLVLDTGMANALAQRFYFREGLLTGALRFGKFLKAGAA
ncbi:GNAT family N-acetyltransferase [Duganella sp. BJB488]|uniref:GNAT family N-acetyltransferase n=1 Tax=Duganella vulcania TaxID=2692166 RepID=A0A845G6B1_9BURK|nr:MULTISPECIES: GNAT family N-acetyltransferase [Duganella]MYM89170.1 GNAT family N-acetyltransferase [Duganella vulcania]NVD70607.1 GNAT family N-acetyltransferase [Duganella sp. BJB1802]RFP24314.1 GNAT family N-acetyltransferase [Duganella sp. BJB489]RFP26675.1 GNAT family N-acetyltransferase [Duganella sp. BJB488]RFP34593.1 GNAT family N-acetyltransferase [Duganella sp. BJB480]